MTVAVTRKELGAVELRREAGRCRDARAARRMLALALVLEGASREEAARAAGMDRQTLRDWVHRYNEEGLPGLHDRRRPGPRPRLTPGQEAAVGAALVLPYAGTEATGLLLAGVGRAVAAGAHAVVVLARAGWDGAGGLAVPGNLTLLPLPSYAPELNPVENVWGYLRQNKL